MKYAIFSDVHSNLPALESVLLDIEEQGADKILHCGDLVGYGPFPNEVISSIRSKGIAGVMGNYDEGVGFERDDCGCAYTDETQRLLGHRSLDWTKTHVTRENKEFLRTLPRELRFSQEAFEILLTHGSPRRINEYLYEDRPAKTFNRLLQAGGCNLLVCGHTHLPYHKVIDDKHVVNVGSLGKPKDGDPRATYALLTPAEELSIGFRRVQYDVERMTSAIEASELPHEYAEMIRRGTG
ncbi:MAG: metallophosphoesterase family protein [Promethearchaeati archaeon SRVP18_Atabeyarchaeia-1]